jgi:ABC-type multidrug transport system ATPase subunit
MKITLENIGKQYKDDWAFQHINFEFHSGEPCVVLGPNGSGKSTLINIISTHMLPTTGNIGYFNDSKKIKQEEIFKNISVCSPYIELIEEFTLLENIQLFCSFKKLLKGLIPNDLIDITQLNKTGEKKLGQFSSGMKQRVKLALAVLADVPVILLDEPCMNLDLEGIDWYKTLISKYAENRLIVVSSNSKKYEFEYCIKELHLVNFK